MNDIDIFLWAVRTGKTHSYYDKVTKYADKLKTIATGENIETLMRQFNARESDQMFAQRKNITQNITKTVWRNLIKPQYKVPRSNSMQRTIMYGDGDHERLRTLDSIIENFSGDISLDKYLGQEWIDLANIDPNAFIVIEWKPFGENEHAKPYPFEVNSHEAVFYDYDDDDKLMFLMVRRTYSDLVLTKDGIREKDVEEYIWYGRMQTHKLTQIHDESVSAKISYAMSTNPHSNRYVDIDDNVYLRSDKGTEFILESFTPHNLGFVPARVTGFVKDPATRGFTRLSMLDEAEPILMKIIKANSELDLTMALHAFPQKIQYTKRCSNKECVSGYLIDGGICPSCEGEGFEAHKTAQDVIYLSMPRAKEDIIDLENVVRYVYPPVDLVKFQEEYIRNLTVMCKEAIYNTELFSRKQIAETATGKNIDLQNVYDSLYPMADAYAKLWAFFVEAIARITDLRDGLVFFLIFSKDFKMKSLTDLYEDLVLIGQSGGDEFLKQSIQNDIATIIYSDNKRELLRYGVKKELYPFNGKSEKEVMLCINSPFVSGEIKTLWANYGWVFDAIEVEQSENGVDFYELPRKKQKEILMAKVKTIMPQKTETNITPFPIRNEQQRQGNTSWDRPPAN